MLAKVGDPSTVSPEVGIELFNNSGRQGSTMPTPRLPPGTLNMPSKYHGEEYQKWDGLLCRLDPHRSEIEHLKAERKAAYGTNVITREQNIASLREARAQLALHLCQVCAIRTYPHSIGRSHYVVSTHVLSP